MGIFLHHFALMEFSFVFTDQLQFEVRIFPEQDDM